MTTMNPEMTVGALVTERPSRSRIFEKLGIDYCCGGKLPLSQACARRGLDAASVLATLEAAEDAPPADAIDPARMSMTALCDHIVQTHHEYLRAELPRLQAMVRKVEDRHGENYPWLAELAATFLALEEELTLHMMKEERILFPAIRDLEAGRPPSAPCGSHLSAPIGMMEDEHDSAGRALARMRELTDGYTPPLAACNTFRAMLDGLAQLEADLHLHIHKENNVLFVRAMETFGRG